MDPLAGPLVGDVEPAVFRVDRDLSRDAIVREPHPPAERRAPPVDVDDLRGVLLFAGPHDPQVSLPVGGDMSRSAERELPPGFHGPGVQYEDASLLVVRDKQRVADFRQADEVRAGPDVPVAGEGGVDAEPVHA